MMLSLLQYEARNKLHNANILLMYGPVGLILSFLPADTIQNWVRWVIPIQNGAGWGML